MCPSKPRRMVKGRIRERLSSFLSLWDNERRQIARDLHDSTGQKIAGLILDLSVVRHSAVLDLQSLDALNESFSLIMQISDEIRTLSYLMHPPLLDECGLLSAISCYAEGLNKRNALKVTVEEVHTLGRLVEHAEINLFRIVQAALTNAYLHSGSRTATVRLDQAGGNLIVDIIDQGHGIPAAQRETRIGMVGVGLIGIEERLELMNGTMEIASGNQGTTIRAVIPMHGIERKPKPRFAYPPMSDHSRAKSR